MKLQCQWTLAARSIKINNKKRAGVFNLILSGKVFTWIPVTWEIYVDVCNVLLHFIITHLYNTSHIQFN